MDHEKLYLTFLPVKGAHRDGIPQENKFLSLSYEKMGKIVKWLPRRKPNLFYGLTILIFCLTITELLSFDNLRLFRYTDQSG